MRSMSSRRNDSGRYSPGDLTCDGRRSRAVELGPDCVLRYESSAEPHFLRRGLQAHRLCPAWDGQELKVGTRSWSQAVVEEPHRLAGRFRPRRQWEIDTRSLDLFAAVAGTHRIPDHGPAADRMKA